MEELIKIKNENGKQLVSGRELHEFLEVGKDFTTWIKGRISKYKFIENEDFTVVSIAPQNRGANNRGGQNKTDYIIITDMAKELSMVENNEKGRQARKYFIDCEKKLKEVANSQQALPQDYLSALKALVASEEEKALMKPKVEYYENVLKPDTYVKFVTSTAIAKDLNMSARKLNSKLNELKLIYKGKDKNWYLYKEHENLIPKYCDYIINEYGQTLKFTEAGREYIINLLKDNGVI